MAALRAHRTWLEDTDSGRARRRTRAREHLLHGLRDVLADATVERLSAEIELAVARIEARELDPYAACDELLRSAIGS
jgi:hypothetical protein